MLCNNLYHLYIKHELAFFTIKIGNNLGGIANILQVKNDGGNINFGVNAELLYWGFH